MLGNSIPEIVDITQFKIVSFHLEVKYWRLYKNKLQFWPQKGVPLFLLKEYKSGLLQTRGLNWIGVRKRRKVTSRKIHNELSHTHSLLGKCY